MDATYQLFANLRQELSEVPYDSIVSRTIFGDDSLKVILFGFAQGQELSEHTAARPASLHILEGDATLTLGKDSYEVGPGAWVHMPPNLPHSIYANTPVVMLLQLL